jgi:broad specificity phosphatase PhoE
LKTHPLRTVRLHLIRHGEVEGDWKGVFAGSRVDMGLSPAGHAQAGAIAGWIVERKIDAVFSSPMLRVRQTMAPLLVRQPLAPVFLDGLREVDFGDFTGLRWEQVRERLGVTAVNWLHVLDHPGLPNGESAAALLDRVRPCVEQILATPGYSSAAVFCHGGIVRAILAVLMEIPFTKIGYFRMDYGSVTVVDVPVENPRATEVALLNFCPPAALRDR